MSVSKFEVELQGIVTSKEGTLLSPYVSTLQKVKLQCSAQHPFEENLLGLRKGKWCGQCSKEESNRELEKILEGLGLNYMKGASVEGCEGETCTYCIAADPNPYYLDIDEEEVFTGDRVTAERERIRKKHLALKGKPLSLIRVPKSVLTEPNSLEEFLASCFESESEVHLCTPDRYGWLFVPRATTPGSTRPSSAAGTPAKSELAGEEVSVSPIFPPSLPPATTSLAPASPTSTSSLSSSLSFPPSSEKDIVISKGDSPLKLATVIPPVQSTLNLPPVPASVPILSGVIQAASAAPQVDLSKVKIMIPHSSKGVRIDPLAPAFLPDPVREEMKPESIISEIYPVPIGSLAALAYCRVSTKEQAMYGVSVESQKERITSYAKMKGMTVRRYYIDSGISGREMDERKALLQMLEDLTPRATVIVISLTRLARNVAHSIEIEEKIRLKGCYLVALDLDINTRTASGKMAFHMASAFSEMESNQTSERVKYSMNLLSAQGRLRGKPPFGWAFKGKNVPFETIPEEQVVIERIRRLRDPASRMNPTAIAKVLTLEKIPCRKAKEWYCSTVQNIMRQNDIE